MLPHLPTLPFTDPVLIFAVAMVVFLLVPLFFERLRIPGLIGLIVAGAAIGDNGIGLLARDSTIELLGTVGLLYLMFLVGLELDLEEFQRHRSHSILFGVISFALPQLLGTALSLALGYPFRSAILLGAMFASHTLVAYPIASRLGIVKTRPVTTVLGATLLTDLLALLVLAIVSKAADGPMGVSFWIGLFVPMVLYVVVALVLLPRVGKWFYRKASVEGSSEYLFTMAALFIFAYLAHLVGIEPIIGALLSGFALNRLIPEHGPLMSRIKFVAEALFVPFFLLSVGMLVDVRAFADPDAWFAIIALVSVTIVSKGLAAFITSRVFGYTSDDGWVMFGLSVSHAAATMAIVLVGYRMGLFDEAIVNAVVVIILVTCVVGPWAVNKHGRRIAIRAERTPYVQGSAPDRILIPISNPKSRDALLDLAFLLRGTSSEPIHPLMVVTDQSEPEAGVAEAERMLSHAVLYAAGAAVPVTPLTRIDPNVAEGIVRAAAETRSSILIIGWDGTGSTARSIIDGLFGMVLDQVLERTKQLVVVTKLGRPLNATDRIVLIIPPTFVHHPGFLHAARMIKQLAQRLTVRIEALVVEDDPVLFERAFSSVKPTVQTKLVGIESWGGVMGEMERRLTARDMLIVLSDRRGTISWHPKLERLPRQLARRAPENFLLLYPGLLERKAGSELGDEVWPMGLSPERVFRDLEASSWQEAVRTMIGPTCAATGHALEELMTRVSESLDELSVEIRPGVVIPHARIRGIEQPLVCLGNSPSGIPFPHTPGPAHLVFVLLSPFGEPEVHLRALAEIAQVVSSTEKLNALLQQCGIDRDSVFPPEPQPSEPGAPD